MAFAIKISGVDRTQKIQMTTIALSDSIPARSDTLSFDLYLLSSESSQRPLPGQVVELFVNGYEEFGGEIAEVQETHLMNPDAYVYAVSCQDWSRRLDRLLVTIQSIGPALGGSIVRTVLTQFAPEFAVNLSDISDGVLMGETQFDYVPVTSVLDQVASSCGCVWYVDAKKQVHLTEPANFPSPLPGNTYDVDADVRLGDFQWMSDISQIKNRIFVKDALIADANQRKDQFVSDGVSSFYKLFQEPEGTDSTTVISHKPDGTTKNWNVALDPLDSDQGTIIGDPDTAFLCLINVGLRFPLPDGEHVGLDNGEVVDVTTTPMRDDMVFMVEDTDSQQMMASREGCVWTVQGCGIYEHVASLQSARLGSATAAEDYGRLLLDQMAWPQIKGSFRTQRVGGWVAGQSFTLTSSKRDLYDDKTFWQESVKVAPLVYVQQVSRKLLLVRDELIENGDFEENTDGAIPDSGLTVSQIVGVAHKGTASLQLTAVGTDTRVVYFYRLDGKTLMTCDPSKNYTLSCQLSASDTPGAQVKIALDWFDAAGNFLSRSTAGAGATPNSTGWTAYSMAAVPSPGSAAFVRALLFDVSGFDAGEIIYLDELSLKADDGNTHSTIFDTTIEFSNKAIEG